MFNFVKLFWIFAITAFCLRENHIGLTSDASLETSKSCKNNSFACPLNECVDLELKCDGECSSSESESLLTCGCLPNEFSCNGTCIDSILRCDTNKDCADNSDERECETYTCPYTHFKCNNHFCVAGDSICNFVNDCGDNSDEQNCLHRACWFGEFTCSNGQCIQVALLCDGNINCLDGSDENQCDLQKDHVQCGDNSLVHRYFWCDEWPDCKDNHADELNCRNCSEDEFHCSNNRCIKMANVCDMVCDCAEKCEDEMKCYDKYLVINGVSLCELPLTFFCVKTGRCIYENFICDGLNDCQSGDEQISDEFGCSWEFNNCTEDFIQCSDGRCLPNYVRCDFSRDCIDGADELNCEFPACLENEYQCLNYQCIDKELTCDNKFDCIDRSDETHCYSNKCAQGFYQCVSGQCIPNSWQCDFHRDCLDNSDESGCEYSAQSCKENEFRCNNGQCISNELVCYDNGISRNGCADNSHLLHCIKGDWKCPSNLHKCLHGVCIDKSRVCNGQVDCWGSWSDEIGCPFKCSSEVRCECRDVSINCTNVGLTYIPNDIESEISKFFFSGNNLVLHPEMFLELDGINLLDLSNNSITHLWPETFKHLWRLRILYLQDNLIDRIYNGSFIGLANVATLNLQRNRIKILEPLAFYGLSSLKLLDLDYQQLVNISHNAFLGLRNLLKLNLSHNSILYVYDGTFSNLPQLLSLDLSHNRINIMGNLLFRRLMSLHYLYTDEFRFCCLARHVPDCSPKADEFSSCEDLMSNTVLRICIWILGLVAFIGNILVITWRIIYKINNRVHSFLITNLAVGDMCMGIYLLIIAAVDTRYRGIYFIYDSMWRMSSLCQFAGFVSTFSSELSVITLTVITVHRFIGIAFPFHFRHLHMHHTQLIMATVWITVVILAGIPLLQFDYFHNFYGRSGVCLALHITAEKPNGWQYSVFIFLILNLLSFAVISAAYVWMFTVARNTQKAARSAQVKWDNTMAKRMSLIVFTDFCCWMPIIILGIISLLGMPIPPQVFAWIAVFILPLNAAINPILYTLSTAPFLGLARKAVPSLNRSSLTNADACKTAITILGTNYSGDHTALEEIFSQEVGEGELVPLKILTEKHYKIENKKLYNNYLYN